MSVTLSKHVESLTALYRQPADRELQVGTLVRLLALRTNIVAAYGRIESVDLDASEFIGGKFRKYKDIKVRLLAVVDSITKIPQPIFVPRQQSTIKGWLATNPAGPVMPWNRSRILLTTQTDVDEAVEKYGMPLLLRGRTAAAANQDNQDAANNANADVTNAETRPDENMNNNNVDANAEATAEHFPDGTTIADYPDEHHDPTPAEDVDVEDGFVILQHDEYGALQVTEGAEAEKIFERNGVKGDAFHFMKGMKKTWKKRHGMYRDASGLLRDAILAVQQDKLDEECQKLAENLTRQRKSRFYEKPNEAEKEAKRRMQCPGAKVLEDIERVIPEPNILLHRVKSAILFVANVRCAKSGEPLFSKESWKLYFDFVRHIKRGCVSDMPNFDYYYYTTNPSGKQKLHCVRGTSKLEGFHKHLKDMFSACHASPLLAVCLLAVFVHRWNHDRAVERGLIPERYAGFYQHVIIHEMQLASAEFDQPHFHGDLPNPSDYGKTGETCYTPIVQQCMAVLPGGGFQGEESESIQAIETEMTENMEFLAERDGLNGIPVTRMTPAEEPIFLRHLGRFRRTASNNSNQHGSVDWPAMSTFWDDLAEKEWTKPIEERQKIFRKTAHILQAHSKKVDQLENERKTRHQLATHRDNATGVHSTTTVGRGATAIRRDLHESSRELTFRTPLPEPPSRKAPTTVAEEQREVVLVAPVDISRGHCNANVMASVEKRSHIRLPPPAENRAVVFQDRPAPLTANVNERKRHKQRCYRCGWARNGAQHSRKAKQNTLEYCRVTEEHRYPTWQVPEGYNIGDPEGTSLTSMQMITRWRNHRHRERMDVDPEWSKW
jgi:hypothetical protein